MQPGASGTGDPVSSSKPLVSAVIATYNYGHFLGRALDSILALEGIGEQFEVEIIVVDDASTDATSELIQQYPQARYLRLPHRQGAAAARNAGIHASTGQFISFLDADDVWLPRKLLIQIPRLLANPNVGVVYSQGIRRGGGVEQIFPYPSHAPSGRVYEAMLTYSFAVHGACLLIRREAFDVAGYFDESLSTAEDLDLSFRLAYHFQFLFEPEPVMIYNVSPNGLWLTSSAQGGASINHTQVMERALSRLPDTPPYRAMRAEAPLQAAFHTMLPFVLIGDFTIARAKFLEALRKYPSSGRYPWARERIKWLTHKLLLAASSPLSEARMLSKQIVDATRGGGFKDRLYIRWVLAEIWADLVLSGPLRNRISPGAVAYAAARAAIYAPSHVSLPKIAYCLSVKVKDHFLPPSSSPH